MASRTTLYSDLCAIIRSREELSAPKHLAQTFPQKTDLQHSRLEFSKCPMWFEDWAKKNTN